MCTIIHDILHHTGNLPVKMTIYLIHELTSLIPLAHNGVGRRLPRDPRSHPLPTRIHTPSHTPTHNPPSPPSRTPLIYPSTDLRPHQILTSITIRQLSINTHRVRLARARRHNPSFRHRQLFRVDAQVERIGRRDENGG